MRAITVRQPWAWAIIHGGKDIENRTRNIAGGYRGPVAIHAGLTDDRKAPVDLTATWVSWWEMQEEQGFGQRGHIIGVVDLVDVHHGLNTERSRMRHIGSCYQAGKPYGPCSSWAIADHHHLILTNPRPLAVPIPVKGRLGLWTLPDDITEQVSR